MGSSCFTSRARRDHTNGAWRQVRYPLLYEKCVFLLIEARHWTDPVPPLPTGVSFGVLAPFLVVRVAAILVMEVDVSRPELARVADRVANLPLHSLLGERPCALW